MSDEVFKAVFDLKEFNYKYIYSKANTKEQLEKYRYCMNALFLETIDDIKSERFENDIYQVYLNNMSKEYKENTDPARIAIDYIAGMTDDFFKEKVRIK
jgi:dGTPase